jgi:hypothetical protein
MTGVAAVAECVVGIAGLVAYVALKLGYRYRIEQRRPPPATTPKMGPGVLPARDDAPTEFSDLEIERPVAAFRQELDAWV